jgi:hypothetical protein
MTSKPTCGRCGQRRVEAACREADDPTEQQLKLAEGRGLARRHQAEAEQDTAAQHDGAGAEAVGQRSPQERSDAHAQKVEECGN